MKRIIATFGLLCISVTCLVGDDIYLTTGFVIRNVRVIEIIPISRGDSVLIALDGIRERRIPYSNVLFIEKKPVDKTVSSTTEKTPDSVSVKIVQNKQNHHETNGTINNRFDDSLFLLKYFKDKRSIAVQTNSDSNSATRLSAALANINQLIIVERKTLLECKQTVFLSSLTKLRVNALRLFKNGDEDTVRGIEVVLIDYADKYVWKERSAYIDYDELRSLFLALSEYGNIISRWEERPSLVNKTATYSTLDKFYLIASQNENEKKVVTKIKVGYVYPTIIEIDRDEYTKLRKTIKSAIVYLNQN